MNHEQLSNVQTHILAQKLSKKTPVQMIYIMAEQISEVYKS